MLIARYQQALVDEKPTKVIAHTDLTGNPVWLETTTNRLSGKASKPSVVSSVS